MLPEGTHIASGGVYETMAPSPLIEYVDVDSVPGGDWSVTVGNSYSLRVGSKGIRISTTGPIDIYGTIVNISNEAMYVTSKNELLVDGGNRTEIRGRVISLKPSGNRQEVLVEGNLGVAGNTKVLGGMHVEGEFSCIHQTGVKTMYMTEVGYGPIPHTHNFFAPDWTLVEDDKKVREAQSKINGPAPAGNEKSYGMWIPG